MPTMDETYEGIEAVPAIDPLEEAEALLQQEPEQAPIGIDVQSIIAAYGSATLRNQQLETENLKLQQQVSNLRGTLRNLVQAQRSKG